MIIYQLVLRLFQTRKTAIRFLKEMLRLRLVIYT